MKLRLFWISLMLCAVVPLARADEPAAQAALGRGTAAAQRGDLPRAIGQWTEALRQAGLVDPLRREALIRRGEAYRALGHYRDARADLGAALQQARAAGDLSGQALAAGALGNTELLARDFGRAEPLLRESLALAETLELPGLAAAAANHLGNLLVNLRRIDAARRHYERSLALAQQGADPGLTVAARINLVRIEPDAARALALLHAAYTGTKTIASQHERASLLVSIGYQTQRLDPRTAADAERRLWLGYTALEEAARRAEGLGEPRLRSLAQGHLGALYESAGRLEEALILTVRAVGAAQAIPAQDLLLEWEWQRGRLLRAGGDLEGAIEAYRRAVHHIQSVRTDIPIEYNDGRSSFRETLEPVFLGLADLLLQRVRQEAAPEVVQELLTEARDTVESIKTAELRDYFKDACAFTQKPSVELEAIAPGTAVLYPILLPDRLELLVSLAGRQHSIAVPVRAEVVTRTTRHLVRSLRPAGARLQLFAAEQARQLYQWLIAPLAPLMAAHAVDTLVFVPDGALRLVPLAALWDGKRFLVERYAVATAPGLTLVDPEPIPREAMITLLAGLSRPGPVVQKLPEGIVQAALRSQPDESRRALPRGLTVRRDPQESMVGPGDYERVREVLALPGVIQEVNALSALLPAQVLLDEAFVRQQFEEQVRGNPYRIVHIASHGVFGGSPEESFIMTYDELMDIHRLEGLLRSERLAENPVELLTLSACETAEGDDRSPLGLSGVALKSGARSALGSLWAVSDEAVQLLIPEFYAQLGNPEFSKAKALQRAQIKLMQDRRFAHPFYWSAFILIGNWL